LWGIYLYKICKKISDHLYVIEMDNAEEKVVNISKLKRYVRSKFSPPHLLDPLATEYIPTSNTTPASESMNEHADLALTDDSRPITVEIEVTPSGAVNEHGSEMEETLQDTTENSQCSVTTATADDTWFDEHDAVFVGAPDADPLATPSLRRSSRIRRPVDRFQAGL
jgi:hypothetical protein